MESIAIRMHVGNDGAPVEQHGLRSWVLAAGRLLVLLAILAGVGAYGLPRILQSAEGSAAACRLGHVQPTLRSTLYRVRNAVAASGLESLVGAGRVDIEGLQQPDSAWSDGFPSEESSPFPTLMPADGGYEVRWWAEGGDHEVADLFLFASSRDAARYVRQAASTHCRQGAVSFALAQPAGAHALIWTNPDAALQADVFFSRGNRAYRLVDVPSGASGGGAGDAKDQQLIQTPQRMACQLKDAHCPAPVVA